VDEFAFRLREFRRDYTAPLRLARTLRNGSSPPFRSSLANAHLASCGWLGIHEVYLKPLAFQQTGAHKRLSNKLTYGCLIA
jgi:hypothetical protein